MWYTFTDILVYRQSILAARYIKKLITCINDDVDASAAAADDDDDEENTND